MGPGQTDLLLVGAITLGADATKLIEEKLRSGKYASAKDIVLAGLATLRQSEFFGDFEAGELAELLAEGEASIKQHGTLDGDEAFEARRRRREATRQGDAK